MASVASSVARKGLPIDHMCDHKIALVDRESAQQGLRQEPPPDLRLNILPGRFLLERQRGCLVALPAEVRFNFP